jgi:phospholipase/carboxylesterase
MDVLTLGPLRVRRVVKATGNTPKTDGATPLTVVLMHGYGAPGDDLVGVAGAVAAPVGTTFLFPEAPSGLTGGGALMTLTDEARQWWEIDVGRYQRAAMLGTIEKLVEDVPEGLDAARASVVGMLDAYERETKTPSERIVLGGFSQGSMLALDVMLRTERPFAGLAILSGTLLASKEWLPRMAARKGLHVFQSHGTRDPILPLSVAQRLRHELESAGLQVSFTSFDDGHGIPPEVMRDLGTWLSQTGAHV